MKFVNALKGVTPYTTNLDVVPSMLKHSKNVLIKLDSIYGGRTIYKKADNFNKDLVKFKDRYSVYSPEVWIDSGGFSFLKGRMKSIDIDSIIQSYHYFSRKYHNNFDKLFSLDFVRRSQETSTIDLSKTKKYNFDSLKKSCDMLVDEPALVDKFFYIMQFAGDGIYDLWNNNYKELGIGEIVKRRAIGGMSGLRKNKINKPSPFIGIAYKSLCDFIKSQETNHQNEFHLHFLGINLIQDRFAILLLEQLFQKYLRNVTVKFSYDTGTVAMLAMRSCLTLGAFVKTDSGRYKYTPNFDGINVYPDFTPTCHDLLQDLDRIYEQANIDTARKVMEDSFSSRQKKLAIDLDRLLKKGVPPEKGAASKSLEIYIPFNVHSNICIDKIMHAAIERHDVVGFMNGSSDSEELKEKANSFVVNVSGSSDEHAYQSASHQGQTEMNLFNNANTLLVIRDNIVEIFRFHRWFVDHRDDESLLDRMNRDYAAQY